MYASALNINGEEVIDTGLEKLGKRILVTGGCGYIGSITVLRLLEQGFRVSIIDNFSNSTPEALNQVREVANYSGSNRIHFQFADLRNVDDIEKLFSKFAFDAVIHFAGRKAVGESMENPMIYFDNNVVGTINLYKVMAKYNCKQLVFSSSCTVYGEPEKVPCTEDTPLKPVNPYGKTKLFLEEVAHELQRSDPAWKIIQLRYFNPVGANDDGKIGEHPKGPPNNLFPYLSLVANEKSTELNVYGNDYPTPDGTAIRDYIHVMDLADGHICAVRKLFEDGFTGCHEYNLGTGKGTSVLEMVAAFERACGKKIPIKMCPRRPGDAAVIYGNPEKAEKELGWKATRDIEQACVDQWSWAHSNPDGYAPRQSYNDND